ncbi:poly(3-hydroxybutyrate) depolymerase [Micrococcales bacterium 31B]|nr:poly(3-hydroxybutyrate) depolymerase [Micrococcales bacterium 31B]
MRSLLTPRLFTPRLAASLTASALVATALVATAASPGHAATPVLDASPTTAASAPLAPTGAGSPRSEGCRATNPAALPAGSDGVVTVTSGGRERSAVIHVPDAYRTGHAAPVVLAFHGRGSTGTELRDYSGLTRLPAITVFPEGVVVDDKQGWQGASYAAPGVDDVAFTDALLDTLEAQYCVNTQRVFATGKSNGGGFVALLACQRSDRIAAFAPVAGAFYEGTAEGCAGAPGAPVLELHGTADATMLYEGGDKASGRYPSVPEWLDGWAERNGCKASTTRPLTFDTTRTTWRGCHAGASLEHVAILGGGHTWPGADQYSGGGYTTQSIEATDLVWRFFESHPLPRG